VFYGATPRGELPVAVAQALKPAIERFPDTEFVVVGSRPVFEALPTGRKSLHPYMSYESYLDLMASCAVSLSPIEALPLRDTKSDAKFVDASRGGVLTIASPTVYGQTIRHGENGLIAAELADWPRMVAQAFADPDATRRMARQAWEDIRDGRMFAHQIAARKAWYRSLWDRREELNEALMARLPGLREEVAAILG
jgi:glycosyltransferase involved in cell wall biosynthesis